MGDTMRTRCLASTRVRLGDDGGRSDGDISGRDGSIEKELDERDGNAQGLRDDVSMTGSDSDSESESDCNDISSDECSNDSSNESSKESSNDSTGTTSIPNDTLNTISCIHEAQLSPDGSCILTSDYNRSFTVYPLNPTPTPTTQSLQPYARFTSPNPIWAFTSAPYFNMYDSATTHVLVSRRDSYITLHNALWDLSNGSPQTPINIHMPLLSYKLINSQTEAVTAPSSLAYTHDATHFFAGATNAIHTFDTTHTSDAISRTPTIPSARSKLKGGGRGFKGTITALAVSPPSSSPLLAAGARSRHVGLYDALRGSAGEVTSFRLPEEMEGAGVTALKWSPCGGYLYIGERAADAVLVYDVRNFSMALGVCVGRRARGKQRLGVEVWGSGDAHEVWAGGDDGCVRVWRGAHLREGELAPDEVVRVGDGGMPVTSVMVHPRGDVAVAAGGQVGVDVGGMRRGGGTRPVYSERGFVDVLGLGVDE